MEDGERAIRVIKSFRDLNVYKLALEQAKRIFMITGDFPKEETYALPIRSVVHLALSTR